MLCDQVYDSLPTTLQDTTSWEKVSVVSPLTEVSFGEFKPYIKRCTSAQYMEDVILASESLWLTKAKSDLEQMKKMSANWGGYKSSPISPDLAKIAEDFLNCLEYEDIPTPFVTPLVSGSVQFEWKIQNRELEVDIINKTTIGFLKIENGIPISEREVDINDLSEIYNLIHWIKVA